MPDTREPTPPRPSSVALPGAGLADDAIAPGAIAQDTARTEAAARSVDGHDGHNSRPPQASPVSLAPGPIELQNESAEALQSLLGSLPGVLYRCRNDHAWTMEFMSRGVEELTGYPPEAFVERREVAFGELIDPEDQGPTWEAVQAALAERRIYRVEYRVHHRDGSLRWVWEQGQGLFDERGELAYLVGYITDVTARKEAEATLGEREGELARKNDLIQRMMTPILEVDEGTLVVPLIGELGRERSEQVLSDLLGQLRALGARWVVVDVTGLAGFDADAAEALRRLEAATRLLGARCILTGVRPEAASALVAQGLGVGAMGIARTLKDGLRLRRGG